MSILIILAKTQCSRYVIILRRKRIRAYYYSYLISERLPEYTNEMRESSKIIDYL